MLISQARQCLLDYFYNSKEINIEICVYFLFRQFFYCSANSITCVIYNGGMENMNTSTNYLDV